MIAGLFHKGSGLGDQLFRYITTRSIATDKGYTWGMFNFHHFKGSSFMQIEEGYPPRFKETPAIFNEKEIRINDIDVRSYDPEINFITDNTVIDGCFEDIKYWGHYLHEMDDWLQTEPIQIPHSTCVIGFRGGEYATVPDLFLPKEYWEDAIVRIKEMSPEIERFEVHTDDVALAQQFFPGLSVVHDIGLNWRSIRYAKNAIIANSAFYIIPRLLRHQFSPAVTIAPRYWARRNINTWARPACYYKLFTYL